MTLNEAKKLIHDSKNKNARAMLGHIATSISIYEISDTLKNILKLEKNNDITADEGDALRLLINYTIANYTPSNNEKYTTPVAGNNTTLVNEIISRIELSNELANVISFRNIVTDMLMVDIISLDEYIELNNAIDSHIQSAIISTI